MQTSKTLCAMGMILMMAMSAVAQNRDAQSGYASVNGLKVYYEIQGTGKPLVLLHGGMVTIETSFDKTRPAFNKGRKTIAIEQQAHGHTNDIKDRPLTIEQMAEDTYTLLKQLKVDSADFFGWSMGGGIALQIALNHPEMVRKVAVSGTAFYPGGQIANQQETMASLTPEMFPLEWRLEYERKNPDLKGFPILLAKVKQFAADWKGMKTEEIKSIQAPILIILGDADVVRPEPAPPRQSRRASADGSFRARAASRMDCFDAILTDVLLQRGTMGEDSGIATG